MSAMCIPVCRKGDMIKHGKGDGSMWVNNNVKGMFPYSESSSSNRFTHHPLFVKTPTLLLWEALSHRCAMTIYCVQSCTLYFTESTEAMACVQNCPNILTTARGYEPLIESVFMLLYPTNILYVCMYISCGFILQVTPHHTNWT